MDDQFWFLRTYSIFTKLMSALLVVIGVVFGVALIYGWGRLTAFYDLVRAAWQPFAAGFNSVSTSGVSIPATLSPLPIWPVLLIAAIVLVFTNALALTSWAIGQWIDMRIVLAKEERESRATLVKALTILSRDLITVSTYFSSLPRK